MELDSIQNGDCSEDSPEENLISPDSSDAYNVFGDPEVHPRVGDQYQVEIPPLMTESEYNVYTKNPFEVECLHGVPFHFLVGLPIPIMWINKEFPGDSNFTFKRNGLLESDKSKATKISIKVEDSIFNVDHQDIGLKSCVGLRDCNDLALDHEMKRKMHMYGGEGHCLVPGSSGGSWSDIEEAIFLLGLYIFGKNLVQVKRFMDNKTMGYVLSLYYGKFYKSEKYRRWSDCRKTRSRRCVYGQRIFTGLRQQELVSRLSLNVSEECRNTLVEVSKTFGDGKRSLEEYVSTLKAIVGINNLVEAVGIGKGKQDLTGATIESSKSNHILPNRPEVPIGKACSSLKPKQIIKFLTGDYRLSKARSNDLFWEAVWPRLLARGWHSEQPMYSLVFLVPGVKKFSRRRLVKGTDYFDSVTDVLSKVASDPDLLELDTKTDENKRSREEYASEHDDLSDKKLHCYLQAPTPSRGTDLMKFTVVDTSLANGKLFKVRKLRTLTLEISTKKTLRSHSEENDEDSLEVSSEELDYSNSKKTVSANGMFTAEKDTEMGASNRGIPINNNSFSGNSSIDNLKDLNNVCGDRQPIKPIKCGQRQKEDNLKCLRKRRRRLLSCSRPDMSHSLLSFSVSPSLEQEKHFSCSDDSSENNLYGIASSQKMFSNGKATKGNKDIFSHTNFGGKSPHEKPQPRPLIDLNLPQVLPDFEAVEVSMTELKYQEKSSAPKPSSDVTSTEANGSFRRHSTRNRPPTARALEALANGFLTTTRRRKNKESCSRPRQANGGMVSSESCCSGTVDSHMGEVEIGMCNGTSDMFCKFQALSEGNAAQVSGP